MLIPSENSAKDTRVMYYRGERKRMVLLRQELGDVLRDFRLQQGKTLRQVASSASVALGYLSEVERGQKEASSEILASVAEALNVPISTIMHEVGDRFALSEDLHLQKLSPASSYVRGAGLAGRIPDVVPDHFAAELDGVLSH